MIIVMEHKASPQLVDAVTTRLKQLGFDTHLSVGVERTIIGAIGEKRPGYMEMLGAMPGVERIVPILQPFKLAGREWHPEPTQVQVGDITIGGDEIIVMAGPCAVEGEVQLLEIAHVFIGGLKIPLIATFLGNNGDLVLRKPLIT
jgi:3-deoxy-7-phosphoheptulonate synthase